MNSVPARASDSSPNGIPESVGNTHTPSPPHVGAWGKPAAGLLAPLGRDDLSKPSRTMSGCAERARRDALPAHAATRPSVQSPLWNHAGPPPP
jgi:hypothetical protein